MGRKSTGDSTEGTVRDGEVNEPKSLPQASLIKPDQDGYIRPHKKGPKYPSDCYRFLTFILYGAGYGMVHHGGGLVEILSFQKLHTGCGMDRRYVKKSLEQLTKYGYIWNVEWRRGAVIFMVKMPRMPML